MTNSGNFAARRLEFFANIQEFLEFAIKLRIFYVFCKESTNDRIKINIKKRVAIF